MPSTASPRATSASAARTLSAIANLFCTEAQMPSFSSALLAYLPTGTEFTSPVAMRPSPTSLARSKPWRDRDLLDLGVLRRDQHQPVAEQVDARVVPDGLLARAVVHPFEVGGGEDVRRRALLELSRERGACRIARRHLGAGRLQERRIDVVERVLHRGGGEYRDGLVLRAAARIAPAWPRPRTTRARRNGRRRIMAALHPARARRTSHRSLNSRPPGNRRSRLSGARAARRQPQPHPNHPARRRQTGKQLAGCRMLSRARQ